MFFTLFSTGSFAGFQKIRTLEKNFPSGTKSDKNRLMWLIVALIVVGVLLLVAELVLLPGISVAGIGAFVAFLGPHFTVSCNTA